MLVSPVRTTFVPFWNINDRGHSHSMSNGMSSSSPVKASVRKLTNFSRLSSAEPRGGVNAQPR